MSSGSTIVDLTAHRKALKPGGKDMLEAYWREIGGAGDIPYRDDLDPGRIATCLDWMLVLERIAPRQAKIRLAGHHVNQSIGMDPRGMPLGCLIAMPSRDALGDIVENLFDGPSRIEVSLLGPRTVFRNRLEGEILFLPLRDREGRVTRGLAYVDLPERRTTAPIRFEICDTRRARLNARSVQPQDEILPDFELADRAREAIRRRETFRIVDPA